MISILLLIEHLPLVMFQEIRPHIGVEYCSIQHTPMELYYYIIPMTTLIVLSAGFVGLAFWDFLNWSKLETTKGYTSDKNRFVYFFKNSNNN